MKLSVVVPAVNEELAAAAIGRRLDGDRDASPFHPGRGKDRVARCLQAPARELVLQMNVLFSFSSAGRGRCLLKKCRSVGRER